MTSLRADKEPQLTDNCKNFPDKSCTQSLSSTKKISDLPGQQSNKEA